MIKISNVPAFRVALHLTNQPHAIGESKRILLEPDGTLVATDQFAMIVSKNAHEYKQRVGLHFSKTPRIRKATTSITITSTGAIHEHHGDELTKTHDSNVTIEQDPSYPSYTVLIKEVHGKELAATQHPICSIRGAGIAKAYGLTTPQAAWLPTCSPKIKYLHATHHNDLIILATLNLNELPNRFNTEPQHSTTADTHPHIRTSGHAGVRMYS